MSETIESENANAPELEESSPKVVLDVRNQPGLSADTWKRLQNRRERGESIDDTVERTMQNAQDGRLLHSKFAVVALSGACLWVSTTVLAGSAAANAVGGLFIALTLFWLGWRELVFRGLVGPGAKQ